jgi:glycine oxidase
VHFLYCPSLKNSIIVKKWFGKRPRPEGKPAPIIEKLTGFNNILVATGHYRNGILLAPATARAIEKLLITY